MAYLLGCRSGAKVSRYERFARLPTLRTVFACEALFRNPARQLFLGIFEAAERKILGRVRVLIRRLSKEMPSQVTARKIEFLKAALPKQSQTHL